MINYLDVKSAEQLLQPVSEGSVAFSPGRPALIDSIHAVLFLWDYTVTLGDEIYYVWEKPFTAATFLFLLNRYVNLLITILEIMEQAPFQTKQVRTPACAVLCHAEMYAEGLCGEE